MALNKRELAKLPPQERIKKLKLMEEEREKEVDEIEKLIKESMQELKTDKLAEEVAPEQRAVDISRLFGATGEQRLERTARQEAPPPLMKVKRDYVTFGELYQDYKKLKRFEYALSMGSSLSEEDKILVGQIGERLNKAERYTPLGNYIVNILNASAAALDKLKKETGLG
ncbi:hypothetical protein HYW99_02725 [Candidatus Woesearchaeota archaeon]|nr:hypothetical protein [Candidatus Woesearchaeota archaeon]